MTDITAPIDSFFKLEWTTDVFVNLTNRFIRFNQTPKDFPGRPPAKSNKPQTITDLIITLSIKKDGKPDGFHNNLERPPESSETQRFDVKRGPVPDKHVYRFIFLARKEGDYEFTVDIPGRDPQTLVKTVKIIPALPLNHRREDMLALFDKWLDDGVLAGRNVPEGETDSILGKCGWNTNPRTWSIPTTTIPNVEQAPTLPKQGREEWTQAGAVITGPGQGQTSAAAKSFNNNILKQRQAAWDALSDEDKKKHTRPATVPIVTSCGDVMSQFVLIWSNRQAIVNIQSQRKHPQWVKATDAYAKSPPEEPKPGDILYLNDPKTGMFAHVCILVSRSSEIWETADGGGGATPDQTARVVVKPISWTKATTALPGRPAAPQVPMFISVTDNKDKVLDGWIDIDPIPNDLYNPDGTRKKPLKATVP